MSAEIKEWNLDDMHLVFLNDESMNFLAYATIPLHAIGISAAINSLQRQGKDLHGYIMILAHPVTGRAVKREDFHFDAPNIQIVDGEFSYIKPRGLSQKLKDRFSAIYEAGKRRSREIFVAGPDIYAFPYTMIDHSKSNSSITMIMIDDGAGSYESFASHYISTAKFYSKDKKLLKRIIAVLVAVVNCVLASKLYNRAKSGGALLDYRLFLRSKTSKKQWESNLAICDDYKNVFSKLGNKNNSLWECLNGCVLINTQPLIECGMIEGDIDLRLYEKVISSLNGLCDNIVIKPHPREVDIIKYKSIKAEVLDDSSVSQEVMLASLKRQPCCIISLFSSTLLNAKGIFKVPAISLAKIFVKEDISLTLKKQLKNYIKQYEGMFEFPETIEALQQYVQKISDNKD